MHNQRCTQAPSDGRSPESRACDVFNQRLKPDLGWRYFKRGLDDWTFVPGSLLRETKGFKEVFKNGTAGIHYANGWTGLAAMIDKYGELYAPTMITSPTEEELPPARRHRVSPPGLYDALSMEEEDETVAFGVGDEDEAGNEAVNVVASNNPPPIPDHADGVSEEQADAPAATPQIEVPMTLAEILVNIKKCRDEISWLRTNNSFPTWEKNQAFQGQMKLTMEALYAQLAHYNNHNVVSP